jgi:hypothetical protein
MNRYSMVFGNKEKVLNYTCQTYQLTRPNKVGAVMALIRECSPKDFDEWEKWYLENAYTDSKVPIKITADMLVELGERLYAKIIEIVKPAWIDAFNSLTVDDCKNYMALRCLEWVCIMRAMTICLLQGKS